MVVVVVPPRKATRVVENFGSHVTLSSTLDLSVTLTILCYSFISSTRSNNQISMCIYIIIIIMVIFKCYFSGELIALS